MDKELIYLKLNEILDSLNSRKPHQAKTELEGLLNEIKYGIYDK
jgi:hypothetical protein|tara:strand:- start:2009 stop:2140 length:132 start_codon:yes stop_codon:yes gene_type:complete